MQFKFKSPMTLKKRRKPETTTVYVCGLFSTDDPLLAHSLWALVQKKVRVAISQSSQNHRSMLTPSILNRTTTGETTLNPQGRNL
jgi:hypothetical protein